MASSGPPDQWLPEAEEPLRETARPQIFSSQFARVIERLIAAAKASQSRILSIATIVQTDSSSRSDLHNRSCSSIRSATLTYLPPQFSQLRTHSLISLRLEQGEQLSRERLAGEVVLDQLRGNSTAGN